MIDAGPAIPLVRLEIGLAGPPVLGSDGRWWLVGRDGEIAHFRRDDSLAWSISVGATISGAGAADDQGLLFVPTARDLVYAVEPTGHQRWRFRAPAGIVGPLAWVPDEGLVLMGRDRALYWLDRRANLMLRAPVGSGVSAGPTALGRKVAVGTESGLLLLTNRKGKRQVAQLGAAVSVIVPWNEGAVALAGAKAHGLNAEAQVLWSREDVLGIGVAAAPGHVGKSGVAVLLLASGRLDWLGPDGKTGASMTLPLPLPIDLVPEFAATANCVWMSFESGELWEACIKTGLRRIPLTRAPLMRPTLDDNRQRVIVGTVAAGVWSLPVRDTLCLGKGVDGE
jgi:hypothetical protein